MNVELHKQATLKQCAYALRISVLKCRLFTSSGFEPLEILSHTRLIHPQHHTVQPRSSASQSALFDPYSSKSLCCLEKVKIPRGAQGTMAGRRESRRLPVMRKDWRDKDLLPSLTAAVNQANHSTPEFRAYDPKPSCGIQPLCPHTASASAIALANKWEDIQYQHTYNSHTHTHTHTHTYMPGACD